MSAEPTAEALTATAPADCARLDKALAESGLVASRSKAAAEVRAGRVRIDGVAATRPAQPVAAGAVMLLERPDPWVARSAHKLLGAFADFGLDAAAADAVCLDAGASTGGFTQVLLSRGARCVYAVDVGHDQLAEPVASDARVADLSGVNVRSLTRGDLAAAGLPGSHPDGSVDLVVADLSFISLRLVLGSLLAVARPGAPLALMVKPQFELSRSALDKHGVVVDPQRRAEAVCGIVEALRAAGAEVRALAPSRLPGPSGNVECFVLAAAPGESAAASADPQAASSSVGDGALALGAETPSRDAVSALLAGPAGDDETRRRR